MEFQNLEQGLEKKLKLYKYGDKFFANFLVRCENDLLRTKKKIDSYFLHKKIHPEYLQAADMNDPEFRKFCTSVFSVYMPKLSSLGYRVFVDKVTEDESLFDVFKIIKYFCMQTDILFHEGLQDNGDVILFDCNKISLLKFFAFIPYFIKSLSLLLEIYVYSGGHINFMKHISRDVLPKDYDGELSSLERIRDDWTKNLCAHREWFTKMNRDINGSDLANYTNMEYCDFGTNGSFKRLQLD